MKEKIRLELANELQINPNEISQEFSHVFIINLNGVETEIPYRADLFIPTKKIWVEIGLIDPTKYQVLTHQKDFTFKYYSYGRKLENLPSEYHKYNHAGHLSFQKMTSLLKELSLEIYDTIKIQPEFNVETPPIWDAGVHEQYHAPLVINSDYFNLPLGSLTKEDQIREKQFYCGISINELGKYSVFIEAANKNVIAEFMNKDMAEVCELLNKLKLAKFETTAGFGYLLKNKKVRPYYFSWAYLKDGYTDWFGNAINPSETGCEITYDTKSIRMEDFEEVREYFRDLLSSNFSQTREYNRYPRFSLVKAENLGKDEVLPILLEIGKLYSTVKVVKSVDEYIENDIIEDKNLLEAFEQHDEERIIDFLRQNYPAYESYPKRSRKISSAIKAWNKKLGEDLYEIGEKGFEICSMLNKGLIKTEVYDKLSAKPCSYEKFRALCEKACK